MPSSRLHTVWTVVPALRTWKQIRVRGRAASRSCEDLRSRYRHSDSPSMSPERAVEPIVGKEAKAPVPGASRLEKLPAEILRTCFF